MRESKHSQSSQNLATYKVNKAAYFAVYSNGVSHNRGGR